VVAVLKLLLFPKITCETFFRENCESQLVDTMMNVNQLNRTVNQLQTAVGSLFISNVTDLIRGIRAHKEDESSYINAAIQEIKQNEISSPDKDIKVQAIEKLTYVWSHWLFSVCSVLTASCRCWATPWTGPPSASSSAFRTRSSRTSAQGTWPPVSPSRRAQT
jgi:hypothetical protein